MKIDDLSNYRLKMTEKHSRYYYSAEPMLVKTETSYYHLEKGTEINTSCGFLEISGYLTKDDEITGVYIKYYEGLGEYKKVDIEFGKKGQIKLTEGNPDRFRTAECVFEIVDKSEEKQNDIN